MPALNNEPIQLPLQSPPDLLSRIDLLEHLPIGVYMCDANGLILRYNGAAAALWGCSPRIGDPERRFCGSHRLLALDDTHVPHAACPMAVALATGDGFRDQSIQIERPDGSRLTALVNIEVLRDEGGSVVGAVNVFRKHPLPPARLVGVRDERRELEEILEALPAAVYTTDAEGRITFYNEAATRLWGVKPELGQSEFCGSWKLYWPDGTPLPHDECPMAIALKTRRPVHGMEAVAERPDGTRVPFLACPTPLHDAAGNFTGAVNMLIDLSGRKAAEEAVQRLAAIVESSDDAILAKDLNGIITSWNAGATRLFGYSEEEIVGRPVTVLIPPERYDEEPSILSRIRRGERVHHYETVRRRKDGTLIDISLAISPIVDERGVVVGASKIARDISERRRAEQQKTLLLREMNHRVKNLFTLAGSLVNLSARYAASPQDLAAALQQRFAALARAHALTLPDLLEDGRERADVSATLHELIRTITSPYQCPKATVPRVRVTGADITISGAAMNSFALLLHEFATNAAKYGALSTHEGHVDVACRIVDQQLELVWRETGVEPRADIEAEVHEGFGSALARATVAGMLAGSFSRSFNPDGLVIRLAVPLDRLASA